MTTSLFDDLDETQPPAKANMLGVEVSDATPPPSFWEDEDATDDLFTLSSQTGWRDDGAAEDDSPDAESSDEDGDLDGSDTQDALGLADNLEGAFETLDVLGLNDEGADLEADPRVDGRAIEVDGTTISMALAGRVEGHDVHVPEEDDPLLGFVSSGGAAKRNHWAQIEMLRSMNTTKVQKTKAYYIRRARMSAIKCRKDLKLDPDESLEPMRWVMWLLDRRPQIARPTYNFAKAAMMYYLSLLQTPAADEALHFLKDQFSVGCLPRGAASSSFKLKKAPLEKLNPIFRALDRAAFQGGNELAYILKIWLRAGLLTGLRPSEWEHTHAILVDGKPALRVKNGKYGNNRAHGTHRTLMLSDLQPHELKVIREHLHHVHHHAQRWDGAFAVVQYRCKQLLVQVNDRLFPNDKHRITMYSVRHQWSANAKASHLSRSEIAALMGHASDSTAGSHYAKKSIGMSSVGIQPVQEEVDRIRHTFQPSPQMLLHMNAKALNASLGSQAPPKAASNTFTGLGLDDGEVAFDDAEA